ncbi:phage antirepressor KilAC domain-containing protein [Pantoea sp. ACRSB]|uniref:phage antirepressor KilAC domain-containing protein n=1 Tax=Pantoea sp. ACRSB TaxID=2918207 RepID=UPI00289317EA|nr:phage antirepressor KilAC domain-containing protein [Pantoea sp. ACRSB]MCG7388792.1 phage antirepressor KilAC domain-containing protein [Pantoea sp. ACRSB]
MLTVVGNEEMKMSSLEIAELCEKRHDNVMRDITSMLTELGVGLLSFEDTYINKQNGQEYRCFNLPKDLTLTLVAGYNVRLRHAIVTRWQELERSNSLPTDYLSALKALTAEVEQRQVLQNQLAIAAPKAEFYDRYADASGTFGFRQVCKALNEKEHLVRTVLVEKSVMYRLGGQLTPYQNHIDAGRFVVKTGEADNGHAFTQARFTTKGVTYVAGLVAEYKLSAA